MVAKHEHRFAYVYDNASKVDGRHPVDGVMVQTSNGGGHLPRTVFIGLPGIARITLKNDGTYDADMAVPDWNRGAA